MDQVSMEPVVDGGYPPQVDTGAAPAPGRTLDPEWHLQADADGAPDEENADD